MGTHVVSWKVYLAVFLALVVLTVVTVWVAGHDYGPFNLLVALGVAVTKATLVVLYFMHARYSERLTRVVIATSIAFLVILVFLLLTDYVSRPWPLTQAAFHPGFVGDGTAPFWADPVALADSSGPGSIC